MPADRAAGFARELARKGIHLCSVAVPVVLAAGVAQHLVAAGLAVLLVIAIGAELARNEWPRARAAFDALFGSLLRTRERAATTGATWLIAAMFAATVVLPRDAAIVATWAVSVGDAAAALIGMPFGRHRIGATGKSIEGSAACAIATMLGAHLVARLPIGISIVLGIVAAIAEHLPWPPEDNARIVTLVGAATWAWRAAQY